MQLLLVPCMISIANTNFGYDSESNLYCFNLSWHWEKHIEIILVPISNHKYNLYLFTVKLITEPLNHFWKYFWAHCGLVIKRWIALYILLTFTLPDTLLLKGIFCKRWWVNRTGSLELNNHHQGILAPMWTQNNLQFERLSQRTTRWLKRLGRVFRNAYLTQAFFSEAVV